MHSGERAQIPGSFSKDIRTQLQHFPLNSVEGALGGGGTGKGWILSKPLLHSGIDFQPFTQQGSAHPVKYLSDSSDPSGDQHVTDVGEGFLSFCV